MIAPAAAGTGSAVPSSLGEGTSTGSGAGTEWLAISSCIQGAEKQLETARRLMNEWADVLGAKRSKDPLPKW